MRIIKADRFDEDAWEEAIDESPDLSNVVSRAYDIATGGRQELVDLVADNFQMLRQPDPQFEQTPVITLQEHLLREVSQTEEFKNLKVLAEGDTVNAAVAASIMGETLLDAVIGSELETELNKQHNDPNTITGDEEAYDRLVENVRRASRGAAEEAAEQVVALGDAASIFGNDSDMGDAFASRVSIKDRLALADKMKRSKKCRELVQMAGRFQRIALAKRASIVREIPQEYVGVTIGNDVTRMLPSEALYAAVPDLRPVFFKKLAEKQLLMYDQQSQEKLGGGPIVLLLDDSGSMQGLPETWAKAVTLAFCAMAQREKRDLYVRKFGGEREIEDFHFLYRTAPNYNYKELSLELAEVFKSYNGTVFEPHLDWAMAKINAPDTPWEKADIVMITDGYAEMSEAFVENFMTAKRALDFQTFCIAVGTQAKYAERVLGPLMDHFAYVTDLHGQDDQLLDMLFTNAN